MESLVSRRKAKALTSALVLIGLAWLAYTESWWPGIMLAVGLPLALRHFLLGHTYEMVLTLIVFVGTFITVQVDLPYQLFLPILFSLGALYILAKEFFGPQKMTEEEKEEDIQHELEEKEKPRR